MAAVCLAAALAATAPGGPSPLPRPAHRLSHVRSAALPSAATGGPAGRPLPGPAPAVSRPLAAGPQPVPGPAVGPVSGPAPGPVPRRARPGIVQHSAALGAGERRRVLGYWTPARMARAVPIDPFGLLTEFGRLLSPPARRYRTIGPGTGRAAATSGARWTPAGGRYPAPPGTIGATVGRVFLTMNGRDFVCSAVSVRAANRDLVLTAGHCVKDGTGAWARNWTFVPGYDSGRRPYGSYPARRAFVTTRWSREADDDHDVAMVAVGTHRGRHLADVVGALPIAFGAPRGAHTYAFGFPAYPPYDGEHLMYCAGPPHPDPNRLTRGQGLRCDLTAGASGGPWLTGFDPVTGRGTVTSVSSFKYSNDRHTMYGPYFDDAIRRLHAAAERS